MYIPITIQTRTNKAMTKVLAIASLSPRLSVTIVIVSVWETRRQYVKSFVGG